MCICLIQTGICEWWGLLEELTSTGFWDQWNSFPICFIFICFIFINKLIVLYSVKSASVWIICTTPRHQKETSWGGSAQGTQGSLLGVFWVRCSRDVLPGEGHSKQIISLSLAWQHLGVPLDKPEEVAGKREVWASLIGLLPQSLTWDKCKKMDGRMWYKMKETSLHH